MQPQSKRNAHRFSQRFPSPGSAIAVDDSPRRTFDRECVSSVHRLLAMASPQRKILRVRNPLPSAETADSTTRLLERALDENLSGLSEPDLVQPDNFDRSTGCVVNVDLTSRDSQKSLLRLTHRFFSFSIGRPDTVAFIKGPCAAESFRWDYFDNPHRRKCWPLGNS